ncbi:HGL233Wp [Eremothecium sinecaudum]|uniref:HGL233Wp n=1 Tax=Eremothecium sinecaudum TaxID=45286 RepID=A0A0X8HV97_9SACH|nr:HGL233Wp [Eremothecium sinecaudum]AMD22107.1 HGL233Wp [Eremothecium sinecaudum]
MDTKLLLQCFSGTLNHDVKVRTQAESQLKELSKTPGFLGACLDILSSDGIPEYVKLSAALYFKNKVTYGWSGKTNSKNDLDFNIDNDEKPVVKEMLIKALIYCSANSTNCVRLLQPALAEIVSVEYSQHQWDSILEASFQSLHSDDIHTAHIGLLCIAEVFRTYRWKENDDRQKLEMIIVQNFSTLLDYATGTLYQGGANTNNPLVGEMLMLVLKTYKFVTYSDLPFTLQRPEIFIPWANFHVSIVQQELPKQILEATVPDEIKNNPWVKAKKWAYANLYRLFQRYASDSLSKKFMYNEFKSLYVKEFLSQFLHLLFHQIERWGNGSLWLSDESIYYILEFLEQTVIQKKTSPLVIPHYSVIFEHVIFPLLCPNEETLERFETDPQEYIHRNLEAWDDDYSTDLAAISLLTTFIRKKTKQTLEPTLHFVNVVLQNNVSSFENINLEQATKVESCLRIISSILDQLLQLSPYCDEMEPFLQAYVFPLFSSQHAFLRARACEICSKLGGFQFKQELSLKTIYTGVMLCFNDDSAALPVRLLAALALQTFINIPQFRDTLSASVVPTMQKLLQISNQFESDTISGVMQEFVETFPTQLQPFAVELMNNLVQQFLKLAIEFHEASNFNINSLSANELPDESDKQLAALGILSTAISILLSFENSKDIVRSLEQSFYPAAEFILKNDIEDFYREACEFVENSTFLLRKISPISWKLLELIGECSERENSMVVFYLEDFMFAINNYLIYGKDELKQNSFYSVILFRIFEKAAASEDNGLDEIKILSELSQKLVLALGEETSKQYLEAFLTSAVNAITSEQDSLKEHPVFGVTTFNVVLACIVYFPSETLQFLNNKGCIKLFFEVWISYYIPNYGRVYDIKLSLMALFSLISNVSTENLVSLGLDPVVSKAWSLVSFLLQNYPAALKNLKDKRAEYQSEGLKTAECFDVGEAEHDGEEDLPEGEEYLKDLQQDSGSMKFINGELDSYKEDFDDLEEDPLSGSVLDDINIYAVFHNIFSNLQQNDPIKHQSVFGSLNEEEKSHLSHILSL